jgi:hypothetical protein
MEKEKETCTLEDIEIFASGTWNGDSYSVADLDEMVKNFSEYPSEIPLKIGHDTEQKLAQKDGFPAVGWLKSIKRVGHKLMASFDKVPQIVKDLVGKGAYRKVSSEIWWNFKDSSTGKIFGKLLSGVALLGADLPAVTSLSDIVALYSVEGMLKSYTMPIGGTNESEVNIMEQKEYELKVSELEAKVTQSDAELKARNEELENAKKEFAVVQEELKKIEETKQAEELKAYGLMVDGFIKQAVKDGKILPVQTDNIKKLFTSENADTLKEYITSLPNIVNFKETAKVESNELIGDTEDMKLHNLAVKIKDEKKLSYKEALREASKLHPELKS